MVFELYQKYGYNFSELLLYFKIVFCVVVGIIGHNTFNPPKEKDLTNKEKLVATLLLSMLLFFGLSKKLNEFPLLFISTIMGLSGDKLIRKWYDEKVWERFDFVSNLNKIIDIFKKK